MEGRRYKTIGHTQAYKTYSLLEQEKTEEITGVPMPSLDAITMAKRTVDENEL